MIDPDVQAATGYPSQQLTNIGEAAHDSNASQRIVQTASWADRRELACLRAFAARLQGPDTDRSGSVQAGFRALQQNSTVRMAPRRETCDRLSDLRTANKVFGNSACP